LQLYRLHPSGALGDELEVSKLGILLPRSIALLCIHFSHSQLAL
jgi:hypothetical protein